MQQELEDLHRRAASHYLKGEFDAARQAWEQVLDVMPDDERAREGVRLCGQAGATGTQAAPEGQPVEVVTLGVASVPAHGQPTSAVACPPDDEPQEEAGGDGAVARELQRRIDSLLAEAAELADQNKIEEALRALDRVLILDEENEQALRMQSQLGADFGDGLNDGDLQPEVPAPDPELAVPLVDLDSGVSQDAPGLAPGPMPEPPMPEPTEDAGPAFEDPDVPAVPPVSETPVAAAPKKRPALRLSDRRVLMGVGGVVVLVAAFFGMRMMGGGDAPSVEQQPRERPARATPPARETEPAPPAPQAPPPVDVAALVQEAETAFDSGDYGAAVIAYDKAMKLDPDAADIRENLNVAAERYREEQAREARWDEAITAFEEGSYAEALRLFYRMSPADYDADLESFKVNGWYNLGLGALKANDCNRAADHFAEARTLRPGDKGVLAALELADLCRGPAVQADIDRLQYRALND